MADEKIPTNRFDEVQREAETDSGKAQLGKLTTPKRVDEKSGGHGG